MIRPVLEYANVVWGQLFSTDQESHGLKIFILIFHLFTILIREDIIFIYQIQLM